MGILGNIGKRTNYFNKLGNGVGHVTDILDEFESSNDYNCLLYAAWVCKVGVQENILNGQLSPQYWLCSTIRGHLTRITVQEAFGMSIGRLMALVKNNCDKSFCDRIVEIIDGGDAFEEIDCQMPDSKRKLFQVK